jgi:tetratricopeptide (TPR) repeat protein
MVESYEELSRDAVEHFGGKIAHHWGDGLLAYFGYPQAHEDDPERAVRSGLSIHERMDTLNAKFAAHDRPKLSARVGIHAGIVVVGGGAPNRADVFGDVPNIAARTQNLAGPGTVFITTEVWRLVSGLFLAERIGSQHLKGIAEPIEVYRVIQPTGARRKARLGATPMTRLVGRDDQLRQLTEMWQAVRDSKGKSALIVGEPGVGKSRLLLEFRTKIERFAHTWVECEGDPLAQNTPLYPVVQMLKRSLGMHLMDPMQTPLQALKRSLKISGLEEDESVPLIAPILGIEIPDRNERVALDPQQQHHHLLTLIAAWMLGLARLQPLAIVAEDLHWADPSTLELMVLLAAGAKDRSILLLGSARPAFPKSWLPSAQYSIMTLNRLSDDEVRSMIKQAIGSAILPHDIVEDIVDRTSGVPLFVEELTRLTLKGDRTLLQHEVPVTLQDSLTARLDALGRAKDVAELGALIGRAFSYRLIRAVWNGGITELDAGLKKLRDEELLDVRGEPPEAAYEFRHALIQDAASSLMLKSRRRALHRELATELSREVPPAEATLERIAHHLTEAGEFNRATDAWQKAADRAVSRGALLEAEEFYRRSISTVRANVDVKTRGQQELALHLALAQVLISTKGYAAAETEAAIEVARALGDRLEEADQPVLILLGLGSSALQRGELTAAETVFGQALIKANHAQDQAARCWASLALGIIRFNFGEVGRALELYSRSIELYDEQQHALLPMDPKIEGLCHASLAEWHLGFADRARERMSAALRLADAIRKPFEIGGTRHFAASLFYLLGDHAHAKELSEAAIAATVEHQLPMYHDTALIVRGRALVEEGCHEEGIAMIDQGISSYRIGGNRLALRGFLCILAQAQARAGLIEQALATINQSLSARLEERVEPPNLLCLRGELFQGKGDHSAAERDFREAVALSRQLGSKAYELRASTRLARHLNLQGRHEEANLALAEIYASFVEGYDTRDLREARSLLNELNPNS